MCAAFLRKSSYFYGGCSGWRGDKESHVSGNHRSRRQGFLLGWQPVSIAASLCLVRLFFFFFWASFCISGGRSSGQLGTGREHVQSKFTFWEPFFFVACVWYQDNYLDTFTIFVRQLMTERKEHDASVLSSGETCNSVIISTMTLLFLFSLNNWLTLIDWVSPHPCQQFWGFFLFGIFKVIIFTYIGDSARSSLMSLIYSAILSMLPKTKYTAEASCWFSCCGRSGQWIDSEHFLPVLLP